MKVSSLSKGLIGHWLLDSTHKARDLSGYENHGTAQGGLTIGGAADRHGQAGGATGPSDSAAKYIALPSQTLLSSTGYAISFWHKPSVDASSYSRVMGDGTTNNYINLRCALNRIYFYGNSTQVFVDDILGWSSGWRYFVFSQAAGGNCTLYIDSVSKGAHPGADFTLSRLAGSDGTGWLTGSLADVRIYNRALSQTEITMLYDSYRPSTVLQSINESGLLLHLDAGNKSSYPGTGATWKDISGNGYNATLVHSPTYSAANGGILTFDGSNDYAYTTATAFTANTDYTIQIWQKNTESTNRVGILFTNKEYWNEGEGVHILNITSPLIFYSMTRTNSGSQEAGFDITLPATSWTLITVKRASNLYYTYRDTTVVRNGDSITGTITDQYNYFSIAGSGSGGAAAYAWPGKIAQVLVYQRALSAAEILQNYNATKGRFGL